MLKKNRIYFNLTLIIIFFFIILSVDFIYTNINKFIYPFNYEDPKSQIYKNFKPNLKETYISPITGKTLFCTDNNGFRGDCSNLNEKKFDYLIIGNNFAEGNVVKYDLQNGKINVICFCSDENVAKGIAEGLNLLDNLEADGIDIKK